MLHLFLAVPRAHQAKDNSPLCYQSRPTWETSILVAQFTCCFDSCFDVLQWHNTLVCELHISSTQHSLQLHRISGTLSYAGFRSQIGSNSHKSHDTVITQTQALQKEGRVLDLEKKMMVEASLTTGGSCVLSDSSCGSLSPS